MCGGGSPSSPPLPPPPHPSTTTTTTTPLDVRSAHLRHVIPGCMLRRHRCVGLPLVVRALDFKNAAPVACQRTAAAEHRGCCTCRFVKGWVQGQRLDEAIRGGPQPAMHRVVVPHCRTGRWASREGCGQLQQRNAAAARKQSMASPSRQRRARTERRCHRKREPSPRCARPAQPPTLEHAVGDALPSNCLVRLQRPWLSGIAPRSSVVACKRLHHANLLRPQLLTVTCRA